MRSRAEILYRLRQELANLRLCCAQPRLDLEAQAPLSGLPDPRWIAEILRDSPVANRLEQLAKGIVAHRFPLFGVEVDAGRRIAWRRDARAGIESGLRYFRLIPYLDAGRVGDHKLIWELNRHQHLVVLAQAFLCSGQEEFLGAIRAQMESWWEQNPPQRGINWASALEVGFRALSWMWTFHLAGSRMAEDFRRRLLRWLYWHGCHLEANLSVYFSPNTHLLGESVALHALGRLFPQFPGAVRWERTGAAMVETQIERQVRDDGSHFEQSSYYHLYALDFFLFHALLSAPSPEYLRKLELMAGYLAALMGPSRRLPMLGDDDGGRVFHPYGERAEFGRATLATCAALLGPDRWPCEREDVLEQALWWIGPEALERVTGNRPGPAVSRWFPGAGIGVLQSGEVQALVDAGPFGAGSGGHSHSDTLSLVARHGGADTLIDPGTYTYVAEPAWREWFRGAAAHNTLRIDGRDQAAGAGPFRWRDPPRVNARQWSSGPNRDLLEGTCEYAGLVHRRWVALLKRAPLLLVVDEVNGPDGEHLVEQFWHAGDPCVRISPRAFRIADRACLVVGPLGQAELSRGGEHGWRSPAPGVKLEAPVIRVWKRARLPVRFAAAIWFPPAHAAR